MLDTITVIVPSYNTLYHLQNTYASIRKYYPTLPLILVDDASTDGTDVWLHSLDDSYVTKIIDPVRRGHTFWYDEGMRISNTDIVAILHSDMIIGPNYFENLVKHLKPKTVVCATRIEPPIHPPGQEKIVQNFGMDYFDIQWNNFEQFCLKVQTEQSNNTTRGIFAPWILFKEDHLSIGGHDQNFAPYGYEDSDIFNRWILAGYDMVQSRDALVYHLTCRGHRWNKGVGIENADYKETMERGRKHFLRKWNQWIQNDEYMFPIIYPKYNISLNIKNCKNTNILMALEPLFHTVFADNQSSINDYINQEQNKSTIDLHSKIRYTNHSAMEESNVVATVDTETLNNTDVNLLQQLPLILQEMQEGPDANGIYELGNIQIQINKLENTLHTLIQV
jgi:glycosyltransferase involved in cell wall biosynthesis